MPKPVAYVPHEHADGGLYIPFELGRLKHPETGEWLEAVHYRPVGGGMLLSTTTVRWHERFRPVVG